MDVLGATSRDHAADLLHAYLIQVLSSIGREHLDVLCLPLARELPDHAAQGALDGARAAQAEGLVGALGLGGPDPDRAARILRQHTDLEFAFVRHEHAALFDCKERLVVAGTEDVAKWLNAGLRALASVSSPMAVRQLASEVALT